jgi:hypothetical protein
VEVRNQHTDGVRLALVLNFQDYSDPGSIPTFVADVEGNGAADSVAHSYVTEDKVYCVYLAPDEDTIREHARRTGVPPDRVAAVRRIIDPANLK